MYKSERKSKVFLISRVFSSSSKAIKLNLSVAVAIKNQIMEIFAQEFLHLICDMLQRSWRLNFEMQLRSEGYEENDN